MRTKALIDKKGSGLTRDDASRHLGANLCRCTGYVKILDAVDVLARTHDLALHPENDVIGGEGTRCRCPAPAASGRPASSTRAASCRSATAATSTTWSCPGMLHAALRADRARPGRDRWPSTRPPRWPLPGVEAVFTAADIPGELRVGIIHTDWPVMIPVGGRTSYLGDVLAIVVADDRGRRPAGPPSWSTSTYDVLRPITDPVAAIDDPEIAVWGTDSNVLSVSTYARGGDAAAALEASAHAVHEVFQTQRIEHAFLEPESTLAVPGRRRRAAARVLRRPGRVGRPQPDRLGARRRAATRSPSSWCRTAARSAARRT